MSSIFMESQLMERGQMNRKGIGWFTLELYTPSDYIQTTEVESIVSLDNLDAEISGSTECAHGICTSINIDVAVVNEIYNTATVDSHTDTISDIDDHIDILSIHKHDGYINAHVESIDECENIISSHEDYEAIVNSEDDIDVQAMTCDSADINIGEIDDIMNREG